MDKNTPVSPELLKFLNNDVGLHDRVLQAATGQCPETLPGGLEESKEAFAKRIAGEALSDIPLEISAKGQAINRKLKEKYGSLRATDVVEQTIVRAVTPALAATGADRESCGLGS